MGLKVCTKCGEEKSITKFSKDSSKRDGLRTQCKDCTSISAHEMYVKNAEKIKANSAKWRSNNPEKAKDYYAKWRSANLDKANANNAKWRAANQLARRVHCHNRRAKIVGKLSAGISEKLFHMQRGKCACCGKPLGDDYHLDHIMPLALGGTNTDNNMQLLRAICNLQKRAKHPVDFMQQRGFLL